MSALRAIWGLITFRKWRMAKWAKIRRERYEELKEMISQRHFGGYAGLIVKDPKYDRFDMACFGPPMYGVVKNQDMHFCIFWDRARMTREIGVGAPLRDGEVVIGEATDREGSRAGLWTKSADQVDEQKPLTHQKAPSSGEDDV